MDFGPTATSSRTLAVTNWCSGSWNTMPMRPSRSRLFQVNTSLSRCAGTMPSAMRTWPATGLSRPARVSANVDFPAPFLPVSAVISPAWKAISTCSPSADSRPKLRSSAYSTTSFAGGSDLGAWFSMARPGTHAPPSASTSPIVPNTSCGVPSASTPLTWVSASGLPSTMTRSTRSSHTSMWCSTTTSVSWVRSSTSRTASCTSLTPSGSRLAVGSSSSSSPGCMASTPANARRWRCPPDRRRVEWPNLM